MRATTSLCLVVLLGAACPGPARPTARDGAPGPAARAATAAPAAGAPDRLGQPLPPAPPAGTGADLSARRSPTDPADRRKKPMSIEALYRVRPVGDPRWSPDGARLLFTVTEHDLKAGKSNTDIYRVDADGKNLQRMTTHAASDSQPRWAPDGRSFLFVSTRKDGAQIWRMPADGGEAQRLTTLSTGVEDPVWSPDGTRIAFVSRVFPEHGADDAKNKAALEAAKKSRAYLADELLYRHWDSFREGRRRHVLLLDVASGKVSDVTPGDFDSPAFSLDPEEIAFSPDSRELCFSSNRQRPGERAWTTNKDLLVVRLGETGAAGPALNITAANRAYDGCPAYSPDGRYIAYLRQELPGYESDRFRLALYDRASGKVRVLTERLDSWIFDFAWAADSRTIVTRVADKGRYPLLRVGVTDGATRRLALPSARAHALSPRGRLAFTFHTVGKPLELYTADGEGRDVRRITAFNDALVRGHDIRPVEELWIEGAAGKKVHTFIVKPHGFRPGVRYPLIVNVHGGPQYQWEDGFRGDWQVYPAAGYVVAFPNPHGSIGYGQAYTAAISRDWGGKVYEDIMKVTDALARLPYVDASRIGAMGWSYGGYMMNWIAGHTGRFKALASMMSLYDLTSFYGATEELWFPEWDLGGTPWANPEVYRRWSPSTYAARFKTPTLVLSGMLDFRSPYTQSLQLFTALRRQGVPARLLLFKEDGHWPSWVKSMPLYYAAHLDWFHRYLGGAPSPYDVGKLARGQGFGD